MRAKKTVLISHATQDMSRLVETFQHRITLGYPAKRFGNDTAVVVESCGVISVLGVPRHSAMRTVILTKQ